MRINSLWKPKDCCSVPSVWKEPHVFLTVGIIDLLMSSAAWRGWSILRGDASNNAPLRKRDSEEVVRDEYSLDQERPSTRFMVTTAGLGIVTFSIGFVLLLLYSSSRSSGAFAANTACCGRWARAAFFEHFAECGFGFFLFRRRVHSPTAANAHRSAAERMMTGDLENLNKDTGFNEQGIK